MSQEIVRVILDVDGGIIRNIRTTGAVQVIILDADIEGADPTHCETIEGSEVYITVDTPTVTPEDSQLKIALAEIDNYLDQLEE